MTGLVLYGFLFLVVWSRLGRQLPAPLALSRTTVLVLAGPAVLLSGLARAGVSGGPLAGPALLAGLAVAGALVVWRDRAARPPLPFALVGFALAAAIVCPRPEIGPASIARDGYAHLAWSRDLVGMLPFYVPGFPAFLSTLTADGALVGAFRVAPALLLVALFLTLVALGRQSGWGRAGLAGCAVLVAMPAMAGRLSPALPEAMAYPLLVATWVEVEALRQRQPRTALWLGLIACALVVVHVSMLEIVHAVALGVALVFAGVPVRERATALGAAAVGIGLGVAMSPMLLGTLSGEPILLLSEQPSGLGPFSVRDLGASWGLFADLAFLGTLLGLAASGRRGLPVVGRAAPLGLATLLMLGPMLLTSAGIGFDAQVFNGRLYAAASVFAAVGWVVLLAGLHPLRPRIARALALLPVVGVGLRFAGEPRFLALAAVAALAVIVVARGRDAAPRARALVLVGLFGLVVAARLWVWTPTDPAWLRALRAVDPADRVLLTHWPAFNAAQARTDLAVVPGIGGPDTGLPLHALEELPPLRGQLRWAEGSGPADRAALREWIDARPESGVLVLVHRDLQDAWSGYARVFARREEAGLAAGEFVYRLPPVGDDPAVRIDRIDAVLRSLEGVEVLFEDEEATLYLVPVPDRGSSG